MANESIQLREKMKEYKNYITEHVSNVQEAWSMVKMHPTCMNIIKMELLYTGTSISKIISMVDILVSKHDKSKLREEEFESYRKHFNFITDNEKKISAAEFEKAWYHHYTNNKHHWEYWFHLSYINNNLDLAHWGEYFKSVTSNSEIMTIEAEPMDIQYAIEMCCDWIAMSMKFGGTAYDWFNNNKEIRLNPKTRLFVSTLLNAYYNTR